MNSKQALKQAVKLIGLDAILILRAHDSKNSQGQTVIGDHLVALVVKGQIRVIGSGPNWECAVKAAELSIRTAKAAWDATRSLWN